MSVSAICATCNTLSLINAGATAGLYVHVNKRLSALEGTSPNKILASKTSSDPIDTRISTLENEITVLLQRLQVYDELFLKMMNRMKEINPVVDKLIEDSDSSSGLQAKKIAIRRRSGSSLMARKEPFVDENEVTIIESSEIEDNDDELFSFLKD